MGLDAPAGLPHLSSSRGTAAPKTGGRFVIRAHGCGRLVAPAGLIPAARQYFHMAAGKDRHFISCIANILLTSTKWQGRGAPKQRRSAGARPACGTNGDYAGQ
nr:MAG TPA: hypothetical protein [Caudoviricetes sp.]